MALADYTPDTFGYLKEQVANECRAESFNGSTIETEYGDAIREAIDHFESERFWFNDSRDAAAAGTNGDIAHPIINLVDAQEYYDFPPTMVIPHRETATLVQALRRWPVTYKPFEFIDSARYDEPVVYKRWPFWYTIRNEQVRVYPTPDAAYVMTMPSIIRFAELSADGDKNPWTERRQGARFIRHWAKKIIFSDIIEQPSKAQMSEMRAMQELGRLKVRTNRHNMRGRVKQSFGRRRIWP